MNEIVKINPKEYGLEENQVSSIEAAFLPKIAERDGFVTVYDELIKKELTPSLCSEAADLRRKLVKVRTGIYEIHKTQKAYFLAAGRFVDAWKNKETAPIEQMEERLTEIEKYFERIEAEKIAKLEIERTEQISKYSEVFPAGLGRMDESVFENYLTGLKVAHEARIKAEQEAEAERLRLIEVEKEAARLKAIEDEKIRIENQKLKEAAEAREREIEAERKESERILLAERKAAAEKLEKQMEDARKLEKELQAKQQAEAAAKAEAERKEKERIAAEAKAAKAPDKVKLKTAVNSLQIDLPKCSTKEADFIANEIISKFAAFKMWAEKLIETI